MADPKSVDLRQRLDEWQHFWNWHRPHTALGGRSPIGCVGSETAFLSRPPPGSWRRFAEEIDPSPSTANSHQWPCTGKARARSCRHPSEPGRLAPAGYSGSCPYAPIAGAGGAARHAGPTHDEGCPATGAIHDIGGVRLQGVDRYAGDQAQRRPVCGAHHRPSAPRHPTDPPGETPRRGRAGHRPFEGRAPDGPQSSQGPRRRPRQRYPRRGYNFALLLRRLRRLLRALPQALLSTLHWFPIPVNLAQNRR